MTPNLRFIDVVKFGNYINIDYTHGYEHVKCSRCYKTNIYNYITFQSVNLCMQCVDIVNRPDINPNPIIPLVTMLTDIYNKDHYINNHIKSQKICQFKVLDRISTNDFKVLINNNTTIMNYKEIMDKYWDHLSFCDKEFFIQFD